jgi:hypothetical protein
LCDFGTDGFSARAGLVALIALISSCNRMNVIRRRQGGYQPGQWG